MKSRPVKRYRAILFSASKGISTLVPVTAPLKHVSADSELELTSTPSICCIFICLVTDIDGEKFPGNTMEGVPRRRENRFGEFHGHVRVNACKDRAERLGSGDSEGCGAHACGLETVGGGGNGEILIRQAKLPLKQWLHWGWSH